MRAVIFCLGLALALPTFADEQSRSESHLDIPDGLGMPVVLKQKLDTRKLRRGERVKFELLAPVLAGHSVVIPQSAKIYGRIVEARPLTPQSFSALAVLVDTVEWKHTSGPLHGYVAGFGKFRYTAYGIGSACSPEIPQSAPPAVATTAPGRWGGSVPDGPQRRTVRSLSGGSWCADSNVQAQAESNKPEHIKLRKTNSSRVPLAMVSTKESIVLKKGSLLVIRNGGELPPTARDHKPEVVSSNP